MSLVLFSVQVQDDDGDVDTIPVYMQQGAKTLADLTAFADELALAVDGLTDGQVTGISITINKSLPAGLASAPVANSEVQKGGLFKFKATGTPYTHSVRIPAMNPNLFVGDNVDETDTNVIAFLNLMIVGITPYSILCNPSNKYEMDLASHVVAVKSFRK